MGLDNFIETAMNSVLKNPIESGNLVVSIKL